MEISLDSQLGELKNVILTMGSYVEKSLDVANHALLAKDVKLFDEVYKFEELINKDHMRVDQMCLNILAKQGPVAKDLRLILSIAKINSELERMGDQAVNISYNAKDYLNIGRHIHFDEISNMFKSSKEMVNLSLKCFVSNDISAARKVILMDDEVDLMKKEIYKKMISQMKQDINSIDAALYVIMMAKNLERLGDHSTNIAEDVIFAVTGKDIRHGVGWGE